MGKKSKNAKKRRKGKTNQSKKGEITEKEEELSKEYMKGQTNHFKKLKNKGKKGEIKLIQGGTTSVTKENVKKYGEFKEKLNKKVEEAFEKGKSAREVQKMAEKAEKKWWKKHQEKRNKKRFG